MPVSQACSIVMTLMTHEQNDGLILKEMADGLKTWRKDPERGRLVIHEDEEDSQCPLLSASSKKIVKNTCWVFIKKIFNIF